MEMNLLDKAIAYMSPEAAFRRMQYRAALGVAVRNWDGASTDFPNSNWMPVSQGPDETDAAYRDRLRARARDLERNNDLVASALGALRRNVIGRGIKPQAQVKNRDGSLNKSVNEQLEAIWKEWVKRENCDIEGQSTFYELQSMIMQRRVVDGEIFVLPAFTEARGVRDIPLKLQVIEADYLNPIGQPVGSNMVKSGVEVDPFGRPVAYHILQGDSGQGYTGVGRNSTRRILAADVWHMFRKFRPLQVRGMSDFAATIMRMKDLSEYMNAELIAARIAACFAGFIKSEYPGMRLNKLPKDSSGNPITDIVPGTMSYLRPGEEPVFANPGRPNTSAVDYVKLQSRMAAAGNGMSYELGARDLSEINYSSARQGHLEDRREFEIIQQYFVDHLYQPTWELVVEQAVYRGLVDAPTFDTKRDRWTACLWIMPGWSWIDPLKEVQACKEELGAGLTTLSKLCAQRGGDWQETLQQAALEKDYADSLGLSLNFGSSSATGGDAIEGDQSGKEKNRK